MPTGWLSDWAAYDDRLAIWKSYVTAPPSSKIRRTAAF